jgi:hypothetical protein
MLVTSIRRLLNGQTRIEVSMAALQGQYQVTCHVSMHIRCTRIPAPIGADAPKVLAFQAQAPIVATTVSDHQPIGRLFRFSFVQASPGEQVTPCSGQRQHIGLGARHVEPVTMYGLLQIGGDTWGHWGHRMAIGLAGR